MKVGKLALANAVKCGAKTTDFLSSDHFDMEIRDGIIVQITERGGRKQQCFTTLMNVKWWHPVAESAETEVKRGTGRSK